MNFTLIDDNTVSRHVQEIVVKKKSHSTWTGEELLGANLGDGDKLPPLLVINMYVEALFTIIKLLKHIDELEKGK